MAAAAQLCFTSAECRACLRSLVVSLSEDIDANVIHKRVRERLHVDENCRASLIQVYSQGPIVTTVDRVPRGSVQMWAHEDMRVLVALLQ